MICYARVTLVLSTTIPAILFVKVTDSIIKKKLIIAPQQRKFLRQCTITYLDYLLP